MKPIDLPQFPGVLDHQAKSLLTDIIEIRGLMYSDKANLYILEEREDAEDSEAEMQAGTGGSDDVDGEISPVVISWENVISCTPLHSFDKCVFGVALVRSGWDVSQHAPTPIKAAVAGGPLDIDWGRYNRQQAYTEERGDFVLVFAKLGRDSMAKSRYSYHIDLVLPDDYSYYSHYTTVLKRINGGSSTNHWMRMAPDNRSAACHQAIGRRHNWLGKSLGVNGMRGFVLTGRRFGSTAHAAGAKEGAKGA